MSMADLVVGGDYWGPDRDATGNHSDSDTDSDDESDILWLEEAAQEAKEKQKFIDILKLNPCGRIQLDVGCGQYFHMLTIL